MSISLKNKSKFDKKNPLPSKVVENNKKQEKIVLGHGLCTSMGAIVYNRDVRDKTRKPKILKVLLDSGSDADLFFCKKNKKNSHINAKKKLVPQMWHTSNGDFATFDTREVELIFLNSLLPNQRDLSQILYMCLKTRRNPNMI